MACQSIPSFATATTAVPFGVFALDSRTQAESANWPPLIMTYTVQVPVNDREVRQVRQLTYDSRTSWVEEVIEADGITVGPVTFTNFLRRVLLLCIRRS